MDWGVDYGGFDHDFVGEVADDLLCGICSKVLREPSLTLCCGQHFCYSCINHWTQKQNTCPHCRYEDFTHVTDKSVSRKVNSLPVHCLHSELGCPWTGELGEMKTHLDSSTSSGCGYIEVACSNNCGVRSMKRKDLEFHLLQECTLRDHQCEHCGLNDTYEVIIEHYSMCSEYPIGCPKGCPAFVKRSEIGNHKDDCPLEATQCPYSDAGCEIPLLRRDLDDHLANGAHQHLSMMMRPFLQMKEELRTVNGSVSELCAKLVTLEVEVHQMQRRLRASEAEVDQMQRRLRASEAEVEKLKERLTGYRDCGYILLVAFLSLCMVAIAIVVNIIGYS